MFAASISIIYGKYVSTLNNPYETHKLLYQILILQTMTAPWLYINFTVACRKEDTSLGTIMKKGAKKTKILLLHMFYT